MNRKARQLWLPRMTSKSVIGVGWDVFGLLRAVTGAHSSS